ncbi:Laccase [Apiospora marii]|uniref:Laccase n=1 Tax=Apiospora marii TaxID=335849 RepID=A0ABR1SAJ8_9PEZI
MPGHRSSGSLSRLIHESPVSIELGSRPSSLSALTMCTRRKTTSALPAFADEKRSTRRQIPLWVLLLCAVCFFVSALILGLGLGLGCIARYRTAALSSSPSLPFNYSSFYGISSGLEFVPIERLVNETELELRNPFKFSDNENHGERSRQEQQQQHSPMVREYVFNITQALAAPDGFRKPMLLVNGQSPGPLIEAGTGDVVRVVVHNRVANRSTTVHWHGLNQANSTWMDGVAGVSQCGIPPGQSFTYEFRVDGQRGTFWYHAHLGVQYTDGAYGPIVVRDPRGRWCRGRTRRGSKKLLDSYLNASSKWVPSESGVEPLADNILLNGQHVYNCSVVSTTYPPDPDHDPYARNPDDSSACTGGRLYTTKVKPGTKLRLRLINASSFLSYWVSIDNHALTLVELDGVEIEPLAGQRGVYLNIGQRVSVVVDADQPPGNYLIRASLPQSCFLPYAPYTSAGLASVGYVGTGVLSYEGIAAEAPPVGVPGNTSNPFGVENNGARGDVWEGCDDMPFDVPKPMRKMDAVEVTEANTHYIEYMFRQAQDVNRIFINKTAYAPLSNNATIWKMLDQSFSAAEANSYSSWDFGLDQQVLLVPDANKGAQIVINSRDAMEHPWHLQTQARQPSSHKFNNELTVNTNSGHTFQIVGWGPGLFGSKPNGTTWNLANPMRRDTVTVPANSHVVLRFLADNPGMWALHCHVAWHMEGGMFVSLAERPSDLVSLVRDMNPQTRSQSMRFCGMDDGQAPGENK